MRLNFFFQSVNQLFIYFLFYFCAFDINFSYVCRCYLFFPVDVAFCIFC